MTTALASGGRELFGWGVDRHMTADLFDALNVQTRVTGNWGKKPPTFPVWPRPTATPKEGEKRKVSVASLHNRLSRR